MPVVMPMFMAHLLNSESSSQYEQCILPRVNNDIVHITTVRSINSCNLGTVMPLELKAHTKPITINFHVLSSLFVVQLKLLFTRCPILLQCRIQAPS